MAIFHCEVKIGSRGAGKSAVAAAAYRSGDRLKCDEDGKTKDFTRKEGIAHSEIFLPENAPKEYADRGTLWNAVEKNENTARSRLYREFEFELPKELTDEQQIELARDFAQELARDGMCVDLNVHQKKDNPQFKHGHIMATTRELNKDGTWARTKEKKEFVLDENGERIPLMDPKTGQQKISKAGRKQWKRKTVSASRWDRRERVDEWRELWEKKCNKALEKAGSRERVDRRSYKARGINRIPQIKLGPAATAIERRRPGSSWKVAKNNERIALNKAFGQLEKEERQLKFMDAKAAGKERAAKAAAPTPAAKAGERIGGAVNRLGRILDKTTNDIVKATPKPSAAPVKDDDTPWSALTKSAQQEKMAAHRFDEDWDEDEGESLKGNVGYQAPEEGQERTKKDEDEQSAKQQEKPAQNRSNEPQEVKDAKNAVKQGADRQTLERHLKKLGDLQEKQWGIIQREAEAAESQAMQAHFSETGNAAEALKVGQAAKAAEVNTPTSPAGIAAAAVVAVVEGAITIIETALKVADAQNEAAQGVQEQQAGMVRVLSRMDEPQGR